MLHPLSPDAHRDARVGQCPVALAPRRHPSDPRLLRHPRPRVPCRGIPVVLLDRRSGVGGWAGSPVATPCDARRGLRQWKMYTAPLSIAESSFWLPPMPSAALSSWGVPTARVSSESTTLQPKLS
jgi:hypothetical protein